MASFLKIVSGIYLAFVWLVFALFTGAFRSLGVLTALDSSSPQVTVLSFLIAVVLSIPAVALFAFGQIFGDVRIIRNNARLQREHLEAMRSYSEPANRPARW